MKPMPVPMELQRIVITEMSDQHIICLREVEGKRLLPIMVGMFEAQSISRRVRGIPTQRPLTHDLLVSIAENLGGELPSVEVSELRDHTFYAKLKIKQDGSLVEIDARPSDAIAVAVTCRPALPIYVSEDVLNDILDDNEHS